MLQALTRILLVGAGLLGGYVVTRAIEWEEQLPGLAPSYVIFLFIILGGAIGFVVGGIVGREATAAWHRFERRLADVSAAEVVLGTLGLIVGLLIAFLAAQPLRLLQPPEFAIIIMSVVSIVGAYMGTSIALTRKKEFAALFPALSASQADGPVERLVILDTSALIDARFVELRRAGFLHGKPRVPRFVLSELQTLADSADDNRRARGRRGLDLLVSLPELESIEVVEVDYPELGGVDDKLMRLCADASALMLTVDYSLSKVARVRGIDVLNLNEAAAASRPNFLPGDSIRLQVTKPGKELGQGVGYLEDGTMVVVQDGKPFIGTETDVEVTSVLQTSAGRMIFARPAADAASSRETRDDR